MPAGLPALPDPPEGFVRASCPPLTLYIAAELWEQAVRRAGHMVVSMGEYGRFRLRVTPTEATGAPDRVPPSPAGHAR